MIDIILIIVLILILSISILCVLKLKKKGVKCIGCPYAKTCSTKKDNCKANH